MPAARKGPAAADRERIARLLASIGTDERHAVRPQPASIRSFPGTGNRAYRVRHAGLDLVARLPGADLAALVDRDAERANHAAAAAAGLAPRLHHVDPEDGAMVMDHVEGRSLAVLTGAARCRSLWRLGRALSRLARLPTFAGVMDPWHKLDRYLAIAGIERPDRSGVLATSWPRLAALRRLARLDADRLVPGHVDPVPDNVIDTGGRVLLIDWEYAALTTPFWDPAYVCVAGALDDAGERALLAGYGMDAADAARLAPWKAVAQALSIAWYAVRAAGAPGQAPIWRREIAEGLACLASRLDEAGIGRAAPRGSRPARPPTAPGPALPGPTLGSYGRRPRPPPRREPT